MRISLRMEVPLDNNNTNNLNSPLVRRKRHQQRKKGLRKVISGMVSSFRNVITGIIPHTSDNSTSHSPDNIPLIDYVTARGKNIFDTHTDIYLGNIPILRQHIFVLCLNHPSTQKFTKTDIVCCLIEGLLGSIRPKVNI